MPPDSRMRESQQDLVSLPAPAPASAPAATTIRENKKILAQTLFIDTQVGQKVSLEHFRRLEKYSKQAALWPALLLPHCSYFSD